MARFINFVPDSRPFLVVIQPSNVPVEYSPLFTHVHRDNKTGIVVVPELYATFYSADY